MPKQLVAAVYPVGEFGDCPPFVRVLHADRAALERAMKLTKQADSDPALEGWTMYHTEWAASARGSGGRLELQWFNAEDEDGIVYTFPGSGYAVLDTSDIEKFCKFDDMSTQVDLYTIRIDADGLVQFRGCWKNTDAEFYTTLIPCDTLLEVAE